ncbi:presenilins-associated rhomboid-like protein, mitochondrial [Glossina fuscipes]|uniref:rhomboid protease n=1 Tax=Glossina fuscipes TaxID=7396 RepID=A0A9C5YTN6_9MUSC|nr:presenilins-associated rhomboid-like protein, mitochondrial [Glossina fuscipes]
MRIMLLRVGLRHNWQQQFRDTCLLWNHVGKTSSQSSIGQRIICRSVRTSARHRNAIRTKFQPMEATGGEPVPLGNVAKAFLFTGAFSFGSFLGASILEYENTRNMMLEKARQAKLSWFPRKTNDGTLQNLKKDVKRHWDQLTPSEKIFVPICAVNVLVFLAWRVPAWREVMLHYFCSNPASRAVCWPMFLSTFSHYSGLHLFANMYVLHSFCNPAIISLGKEQFLGLYLSAGVVASFASILYKSVTAQAGLSLGASGAIMAILAYVCAQYPDTQLSILFLPMLTFSAGAAIKVIMGVDFAGCILGWKFFDHAAHLGGALFGLFWAFYGIDIWQKRLPFVTKYHDWRKTKQ